MTAVWPYDAVEGHRWVEQYRLPVIPHWIAKWAYPAAVVVNDHPRWTSIEPTDAEAAVIASFGRYWLIRHCNRQQIAQARMLPFDIVDGVAGFTFMKRPDGTWAYFHATWTLHGPIPARDAEVQYRDVVDLIDRDQHWGSRANDYWDVWKAAHPDVFAR